MYIFPTLWPRHECNIKWLLTYPWAHWPYCKHNCPVDWSCDYHWSKVKWFGQELRQLRCDLQSKILDCTKVPQECVNHSTATMNKNQRWIINHVKQNHQRKKKSKIIPKIQIQKLIEKYFGSQKIHKIEKMKIIS